MHSEKGGSETLACYASCLDECQGGISREHYISRSVLEVAGSKIRVSGFPWQHPGEQSDVGISALTSKILCRRHNSELSSLDDTGATLVRALNVSFDRALHGGEFTTEQFTLDGPQLELWLLKILCGITSFSGPIRVPDNWVRVLFGREPFPKDAGLYLFGEPGEAVWFFNLVRMIGVADKQGVVAGAIFGVGGLAFALTLGRPIFEAAAVQSLYRPNSIVLENDSLVTRIAFTWPSNWNGGSAHLKIEGPAPDDRATGAKPIVKPDGTWT